MLQKIKKMKTLPTLLCLASVNYLRGSEESQCKMVNKKKAFEVFEADQHSFPEQIMRWKAADVFAEGFLATEAIRQSMKEVSRGNTGSELDQILKKVPIHNDINGCILQNRCTDPCHIDAKALQLRCRADFPLIALLNT
jgi:hypothetical protein